MKRVQITPRENFKQKLEDLSFKFHSLNNETYWDESAYYEFTPAQINTLEEATNKLYEMCLEAVQYVMSNDLYDELCINRDLVPLIERSWNNEEASVYGRFDLAWNGELGTFPKMLEFNADTPTSLYEAAVVQWYWLQDIDKSKDQFNSIHDRLVAYWESCKNYFNGDIVHFAALKETVEDFTTVEYMRDTAHQAGLNTKFIYVEDIGWQFDEMIFVDKEGLPIDHIFKLYPWEWLIHEEFGNNIIEDLNNAEWIEPAWKSILSNKGILPILYKLFPDSPYLLPSYFDDSHFMSSYVSKPIYSREGANVTIVEDRIEIESTPGEYGTEGLIYQELYPINPYKYDGQTPVIGSWIIGGEAAGIGIRETDKKVTDNFSRFVPHLIK